ncbi:MAG: hypothetical protein M0Z45_09380 [Actinomycetota bacterium]|nr:hypothetical protein [Actinomycetota bacterium]
MTLRSKITTASAATALAVISIAAYTTAQSHRQATSVLAPVASVRSVTHKTHFSSKTNTLHYMINGRVAVGQPNFQGALSVVFFTSRSILPQVHIAIDGVPLPDGSLSIRASMADLILTNHVEIVGPVTFYTPNGIRFRAVSRSGFSYNGQIELNVNAITNTFSGQLLLRPTR